MKIKCQIIDNLDQCNCRCQTPIGSNIPTITYDHLLSADSWSRIGIKWGLKPPNTMWFEFLTWSTSKAGCPSVLSREQTVLQLKLRREIHCNGKHQWKGLRLSSAWYKIQVDRQLQSRRTSITFPNEPRGNPAIPWISDWESLVTTARICLLLLALTMVFASLSIGIADRRLEMCSETLPLCLLFYLIEEYRPIGSLRLLISAFVQSRSALLFSNFRVIHSNRLIHRLIHRLFDVAESWLNTPIIRRVHSIFRAHVGSWLVWREGFDLVGLAFSFSCWRRHSLSLPGTVPACPWNIPVISWRHEDHHSPSKTQTQTWTQTISFCQRVQASSWRDDQDSGRKAVSINDVHHSLLNI